MARAGKRRHRRAPADRPAHPPAAPRRRVDWALAGPVLGCLLLLALVGDDRHVGLIADGRQMIRTAVALVETGGIGQASGRDFTLDRPGGDAVSRFGMATSLLQVPAAWLAPRVEASRGAGSSQALFLLVPWLAVGLAAAAAGALARRLGGGPPEVAAAVLLASVASPLGSYALLEFSEPVQAAALALALRGRARRRRGARPAAPARDRRRVRRRVRRARQEQPDRGGAVRPSSPARSPRLAPEPARLRVGDGGGGGSAGPVGLVRDGPLRAPLRRLPGRPVHPPLARRPLAPPGRAQPGPRPLLARVPALPRLGRRGVEAAGARDAGRAGLARGRARLRRAAGRGGGLLGLARHGGLGPPPRRGRDPPPGAVRRRGPRAEPAARSGRSRGPVSGAQPAAAPAAPDAGLDLRHEPRLAGDRRSGCRPLPVLRQRALGGRPADRRALREARARAGRQPLAALPLVLAREPARRAAARRPARGTALGRGPARARPGRPLAARRRRARWRPRRGSASWVAA